MDVQRVTEENTTIKREAQVLQFLLIKKKKKKDEFKLFKFCFSSDYIF